MKKLNPSTEPVAGEDLISRLPDELITHILSYIPTKSSVSTAVLSKRWNRVWISVPNLDFGLYTRSTHNSPVMKSHFFDFVDRVLSLNTAVSVRKFHLSCYDDDRTIARLSGWTKGLEARDCEEFCVRLPSWCRIGQNPRTVICTMPDRFFNQNNLAVLTLENIVLKAPPLVRFPRLKTMRLYCVQFPDDDSMKNLMSGCSVLNLLTIFRGIFDNVLALHICSSTLKHLTLNACVKNSGRYNVVIDAPKLTALDLSDEAGANYVILNLSTIVYAYINIREEEEAGYEKRLFGLLTKISNVEEMVITSGIMRALENVNLENLPIFKNLTKLDVPLRMEHSWLGLPKLFRCTPNLVTFILHMSSVPLHFAWYQPNDVPRCFLASLAHVSMRYVKEGEEVMEMISYFLMNAMVLKKLLIISLALDSVQETSIRTRLTALPRSSRECQVEYMNMYSRTIDR